MKTTFYDYDHAEEFFKLICERAKNGTYVELEDGGKIDFHDSEDESKRLGYEVIDDGYYLIQ
mgnify:CR=1 FL=1